AFGVERHEIERRARAGAVGEKALEELVAAPARAEIDALGLTKKDSEGYRPRADGAGRLRLALTTYLGVLAVHGHRGDDRRAGEEDRHSRRGAGVGARLANEHQIYFETQWGADNMYGHQPLLFPSQTENPLGLLYGTWYASAGRQGKEPPARMQELMATY